MRRLESTRPQRRDTQSRIARAAAFAIEPLESRTLLNATLTTAINPVGVAPGQTAPVVNLSQHFNDSDVPGTLVEITTPLGVIPVALTDSKTPNTVSNFLNYINTGGYNGTIIHRSAAGFALQGGGYQTSGTPIPTNGTINGEPGQSNLTGTISMALSNGPNSGTSQWFINLANNDGSGTTPNLNDTSDGGPFTVFGNVIYNGMTVVNQITSLQVVNDSQNPPGASGSTNIWNQLPVLSSYSGSSTPTSVAPADMVTTSYQIVAPLTYSATSDNSSLINPTISGSNLTLNYGSGTGTTQIHVTATDIAGNTATTTFTVGVGIQTVTVGANAVNMVKFHDSSGSLSRVAITGKGTATVSLIGPNLTVGKNINGVVTVKGGKADSVSISTAGTTPSTVLTIVGSGSGVHLTNLTTDGPLAELNARFASISGSLTASGAIKNLMLGNVSGGTITIGGGPAVTVRLGDVTNTILGSYVNIAKLTAKSWTGTSQINAPAINDASIAGSFAANVMAPVMGTFNAGSITGGTWTVAGASKLVTTKSVTGWQANFGQATKVKVAGTLTSSTVHSTQNVDLFSTGGMTGSNVYAGVANINSGLPSVTSDFTSNSRIKTFTVNGRFVNSNVAAQIFDTLKLGNVSTSNGGTLLGAASHSISNLSLSANGKNMHLSKVTTQAKVTTGFMKAGITPQDLTIRII